MVQSSWHSHCESSSGLLILGEQRDDVFFCTTCVGPDGEGRHLPPFFIYFVTCTGLFSGSAALRLSCVHVHNATASSY